MAKKKLRYDHPAYLARFSHGGILTGNGGAVGYCAFTDTLVKSYQLKPTTAGTSGDTVTAYQLSGTTTTTHVLCTYGSAATTNTEVSGTFTLAKGDSLRVVKGTDATGVMSLGIELAIVPRSEIES